MNFMMRAAKPVMLVSGLITSTMIYAAIAPAAALQSMFGEAPAGQLAELLVRNWGALVTLVGAALIYGAFRPQARPLALALAIVSKLWFIALVVAYGYVTSPAGMAIWLDIVFVMLFIGILISGNRNTQRPY